MYVFYLLYFTFCILFFYIVIVHHAAAQLRKAGIPQVSLISTLISDYAETKVADMGVSEVSSPECTPAQHACFAPFPSARWGCGCTAAPVQWPSEKANP